MTHTAKVNVGGDTIEVTWNGNVWVTSAGAQYAGRDTAMRDELAAYYRASGEDTDDPAIVRQIDQLLMEIAVVDGDWCPLCGQTHAAGNGPAGYSCESDA